MTALIFDFPAINKLTKDYEPKVERVNIVERVENWSSHHLHPFFGVEGAVFDENGHCVSLGEDYVG